MLLLKNVLKDYGKAVDYIEAHGLNATIMRPMGLTKGDFTGDYRETKTGIGLALMANNLKKYAKNNVIK